MAIIKVSIKKTVQEEAYSPVVFELGIEVKINSDKSDDVEEEHKYWARNLQETMEKLILERLEEYK